MTRTSKQEFFDVGLEISRADLAALGFRTAPRLSDKTMTQIASDMSDLLSDDQSIMDGWWHALETTCKQMHLQRRKEETP